jgi:4,5-dihydroxyphthalate decarboxylase
MPVFATRDFRHRCFFVRRDSDLHELKDLQGKRIGSNAWPDTGNTWSRAALREQGVALESIRWYMGGIDDPNYDPVGGRPLIDLPPHVEILPKGRVLREMLVAGEVDALMCPDPPQGFYRPDSPIVRLIPDYRRVEQEYGRRVGFFPAHHIYAIRREVFESDRWIAASLYKALEESKRQSQADRLYLCDSSPWLLADLEEAAALFGEDWQPNGVAPNRQMIAALCEEEYAQRLVAQPIDPESVFADFQQALPA